jgi:hypothetical protein
MGEAPRKKWPMVERDQRISEVVSREQPGARSLIRRRAPFTRLTQVVELMALADI